MPAAPQDRRKPAKKSSTRRTTKMVAAEASQTDPDSRYAPTTWGGDSTGLEDLRTPSGQLCQVRRPGVEGLVKAGVLHDLDSLTAIVDGHVKTAKGSKVPEINVASLMHDQKSLDNVLHVADRVLCYTVVQPKIQMTPNDVTSRVSGVIYADMVDLEDKMFILNYAVGGTRDFERFRREQNDALRGVDAE